MGYISQAIVATFSTLLFIYFNRIYGIKLGEIALIPVLFFLVQLFIDIFCSVFADKIGISTITIKSIGLLYCIFCGFAVGILCPGAINASAGFFPAGGTAMFSFLAMAADIGCSVGPGIVGKCAELFGDNLRIGMGMGMGCIFPLFFILIALKYKKKIGEMNDEKQPNH